jgi:hypothetical protein
MDREKKIDLIIKVGGSILTLATVVIGVSQFNKGQKDLKEREIAQRRSELSKMKTEAVIETLSKFKELQNKLYIEATSVISYLAVNENFGSKEHKDKLEKFWRLYWGELSAVESDAVEAAMKHFGDTLKMIEDNNFTNFKEKQRELKNACYQVAQAIKVSTRTWELPEILEGDTIRN